VPKPGGIGWGAGGAGAGTELFAVGDESAGCVEDVRAGAESEEEEAEEGAGEEEGTEEPV
jgi:hypothetical protein